MDDLIMLALVALFFASCYGLLVVCQRLMREPAP